MHEECKKLIDDIWRGEQHVVDAIQRILEKLIPWNKERFGNIFYKKRKLMGRLEGIQKSLSQFYSSFLVNLERTLIQEYNDVLKQEELFWFQKSRVKWIMDGDSNTKFFHQSTLARRRVNKIIMLKVGDEWIQDQLILKQHCLDHFENIFASTRSSISNGGATLGLSNLQARLTQEENNTLSLIPSAQEIKGAVWATHPTKAPGPDGLQGFFYQHCWDTVGNSVTKFIQLAFELGSFDETMCEAFVCLIPKVKNPSHISEYRPISLCNVLYKFITKCITIRLKHLMPDLISLC